MGGVNELKGLGAEKVLWVYELTFCTSSILLPEKYANNFKHAPVVRSKGNLGENVEIEK